MEFIRMNMKTIVFLNALATVVWGAPSLCDPEDEFLGKVGQLLLFMITHMVCFMHRKEVTVFRLVLK